MKNTHLFYIVFQVSNALPIKSYKILLSVPLFVVVLHQQISVLQLFRTSFNIMKKIFVTNFSCLMDSLVGDLFNGQNSLSITKVFCWCSLTLKTLNVWDVLIPTKYRETGLFDQNFPKKVYLLLQLVFLYPQK